MVNYIEKIEQATDNSIMPLIFLLIKDSYIAVSWNNHDVVRGVPPIDINYHKKLREVAVAKLTSLGVSKEKFQLWYDTFAARFDSFGIFHDFICAQIADGTISEKSMNRLFAKDSEVSNDELNRIGDEYSDTDCALARELGFNSCLPLYRDDQLVSLQKKVR